MKRVLSRSGTNVAWFVVAMLVVFAAVYLISRWGFQPDTGDS